MEESLWLKTRGEESMWDDKFKAIIVGGGPVGLMAARVLYNAEIDFVLLESRPDISVNPGASLVLLPSGLRMLEQLRMLELIDDFSTPLGTVQRFDHQGNDIGDSHVFVHMKESHGVAPRVITRSDLTALFSTTMITFSGCHQRPNKKVTSITTGPNSITAHCADGTWYTGDLLIGADGAHSTVRAHITPPTPTNHPFTTTFRCLYIRFPIPRSGIFPPGSATETHGPDCAIQAFVAKDCCTLGLYERLLNPLNTPPPRYTAADVAAVLQRWGHLPVCRGLTVADAYAVRIEAGLVALEEGVAPAWAGERAVLVGDAAHKATPSTGAGWNTGTEDVFVLANELVRRIRGREERIGAADIAEACAAYRAARVDAVRAECARAGRMTQLAAWGNGVLGFVDRWVMGSETVQNFMVDRSAEAGPTLLEFLDLRFVDSDFDWESDSSVGDGSVGGWESDGEPGDEMEGVERG